MKNRTYTSIGFSELLNVSNGVKITSDEGLGFLKTGSTIKNRTIYYSKKDKFSNLF